MKILLSWLLLGIGKFIGVIIKCDLTAWLYPIYRKVMVWSSDLDPEGKVWEKKEVPKEKKFKREWF